MARETRVGRVGEREKDWSLVESSSSSSRHALLGLGAGVANVCKQNTASNRTQTQTFTLRGGHLVSAMATPGGWVV